MVAETPSKPKSLKGRVPQRWKQLKFAEHSPGDERIHEASMGSLLLFSQALTEHVLGNTLKRRNTLKERERTMNVKRSQEPRKGITGSHNPELKPES